MLDKIDSSLILQKIFTFLDNKIKYSSIVHNKNLQIKLGLSLIDFKRFSGKYKKEEYGEIIEYNIYNNQMIFEGQYSNGKRNGLGIEYNDEGEVIFEGEYLKGKKWVGVLKDYDEDTGKLLFEYEYLNGIINGEVKEYDKYNGDLLFSGKYVNGKRNGYGEEYKYIPCEKSDYSYYSQNIKKITIFSGEYSNGERKEGKEYNYDEKLVYEGEYLNGKRNGKGKLYDTNEYKVNYEGQFLNGKKNGKGIEYKDNLKYEGEFKNGKKNGKFKEYIYKKDFDGNVNSILIFDGEYMNNFRMKGKEYYENGKLKFEGEYLFKEKYNGKLYDYNGNIIFELINGNAKIEDNLDIMKIFIGENINEEKLKGYVKGKEYDNKGRLLFEGEYFNKEKWKGILKEYDENKLLFEGEYVDGKIWNGKGKLYNFNGAQIFDGEYKNGLKEGYIKEYY